MSNNVQEREEKVNLAIEIAIKLSLIAIVVVISFLIAKPFMAIVIWGAIIAVAISPLINSLEKRFGNRKKIIIAVTVAVIATLILPTYALSGKTIETSQNIVHKMQEGSITIPPPTQAVKEWPVIGEKTYVFWNNASQNLQKTLTPFSDEIKAGISKLFSSIGSLIGTVLMFVVSMIISAVFLIGRDGSVQFYKDLSRRLMGDKGEEWTELSTATIRGVVNGVIGVALLQGILSLVAMGLMDVPLAMIWAFLIMFLGILQLPALIVSAPIIAYVFSQGSGVAEIIFAIVMVIISAGDGAIKPILMGRGVDAPMLVIMIGAIGGMMLMGMIGLFIGAVIFALAYKLFTFWMAELEEEEKKEA
ncbi:Hipothetical membrane protein [hydrothermal vent metagenome]|uniref:Hipothetical membrane protein n=1 Tax=hydrothermal vent metagenome TaxID=652676 RepID=A0A1W1EDU8_9ZZZZ